ncbi:hypothetical protein glysoja_007689 [Glycine soja]|nr:hypothetical protein glysoja_007689 [Glycine soja]
MSKINFIPCEVVPVIISELYAAWWVVRRKERLKVKQREATGAGTEGERKGREEKRRRRRRVW